MITHALYLSAYWFLVSFVLLMVLGRKRRIKNIFISIPYFVAIVLSAFFFFPVMQMFTITFLAFGIFLILNLPDWNFVAKAAWPCTILISLVYLTYSFSISAFATANIIGFVLASIFFFVEISAIFLSLTYAFEAFDILCRARWRRRITELPKNDYQPKVSLHIPTYNEPPEVVIKTLENLQHLNYKDYEVLVIDNNTPDKTVWKPLQEACERLGPRFKFVHLGKWPGYKSGALNFGLTATAADAELISIIDADYEVHPDFLKDLVPLFSNKKIAFVQTPQDYRGSETNAFFKAAYYGYKYFFAVSMPSRNERNAIIFAGTMGLIRKSALLEIGGWDEWCITEDAEASLRILKRGYEALYVNKSYGKGLMPLTFEGFKKQRFRWCFGGIQILKKHWESLMPWSGWLDKDNKLTFAQKYYYLVGGLQWYNDLLNLFFAFFLILGGILSLFPQIQGFRPFTMPLLIIPAVFLVTGLWRFIWVLRNTLHLSKREAFKAMFNFFSLGWAVTLGSVQGLVQKKGVFLRTPKVRSKLKFFSAIGATQSEIVIGLSCLVAAVAFIFFKQSPLEFALALMLGWEAALFLSAPTFSLISTATHPEVEEYEDEGVGISENHAARWIFLIMAAIAIAFLAVRLLPTSTNAPYMRYQPNDISSPVNIPGTKATPTPTVTPTPTKSSNTTPTPSAQPTNGPTPTQPTPTPERVSPTPVVVSPTQAVTPTTPVTTSTPAPSVTTTP